MKLDTKRIVSKAIVCASLFCMTIQPSLAALLNLAQAPLFAGATIPPKVLLAISKDQQLFKKAYNDYSDLDGDGIIDTTYKHSINYYGYFDPTKCYIFQNVRLRFEPSRVSLTKLCGVLNEWSGNFLNWISMSRMDAVRKLLYGGLRSMDQTFAVGGTNAVTELERAFLPTDAHAWAKYYNPPNGVPTADQPAINLLTPFSPPTVPSSYAAATRAAFTIPVADGDYVISFQTPQRNNIAPGDQIRIARALLPGNFFIASVLDVSGPPGKDVTVRVNFGRGVVGSGTDTAWVVTNLSRTGISFCNLTLGGVGTDQVSTTNVQPPLMRVAQGNFGLWNANERWQCYWSEERINTQAGFVGGLRSNGNQSALSEISASAENPSQTDNALGNGRAAGEFIVRVQACVPNLVGSEKCKIYPNGNLKPIGLLQQYGDRQRIFFGLMTGSYAKNISGGVLRKNPGALSDEVRVDTDGTFIQPYQPPGFPSRTSASAATSPGIINTLNYMRIYGYNYGDGTYLGAAGDNCTFQLTSIAENSCTSWGNPMSEVFFEAVRYFASPKSSGSPFPTPAFTYTNSGSKDNLLGLPLATWTDPVSQSLYCTPMNVLMFNPSVSTNDDDLGSTSGAPFNSTSLISDLTSNVGRIEGINGGNYFAGKLIGSSPTPPTNSGFELCTAKTITSLGDVSGICPEGPTLAGSFLMDGVAHFAHTNRIRTDLTVPATDQRSLKVTTYAVQLATNVPSFAIGIPNSTKNVVLQPIYRLDLSALGRGFGGGTPVDTKIVRQDIAGGTGKIYVNWEDSEQGGDFDQDMWGTIEWAINTAAQTITITTNAISASTANPQGFGYAISGTNRDGAHFHSGIYGFNFSDPTGALGCTNCNLTAAGVGQVGPQSVTYSYAAGTPAGTLNDPLWYAAKYGGFVDLNANGVPDAGEWDRQLVDGTPGTDGIPDNYFLVTNPLGLETSLGRALTKILLDASGTALAANSTSLSTISALYQAKFNTSDWSGQLLAYTVDQTTGAVNTTPVWDAAQTLTNSTAPDSRVITTFNNTVGAKNGVAFRWTNVSPLTVGTELNKNPDTNVADGKGSQRLDYLRGVRTLETGGSGTFRQRSSVLGDIVDSSPVFVGPPNATVLDTSYAAFRDTHQNRKAMVYVGANDGMLHGFEATATGTGQERLAYIPSKTFTNLNDLTSVNYVHKYYVDATPEVQDAFVNSAWRTVLVSGLAGGGQGLFALDVTNPDGGGSAPAFTETNASRVVLWEFNDSDDKNLGYTYGKPLIRKMQNGRWAAIVSGGYNNDDGDTSGASNTGKAFLFIIFLDGPQGVGRTWREILAGSTGDYVKIPTGVGSVSTPNALAQPFAADVRGDGQVDYIYAGDLYGNFWKFDVTSTTVSDWRLASNRVVLFQARDPIGNAVQPITTAAEGTPHPTGKGFILTFGTGKYLEFADTVPPFQKQSFYGIWDKNDAPSGSGVSAQTTVTNRNQLLVQTITEVTSGANLWRVVSNNAAVWSTATAPPASDSPPRNMGWVIDFPRTDGERVIVPPILISARLIFATNVPSSDTCAGGGAGYLMVVNPSTGGVINSAVIDTNGDGKLNVSDQLALGGQQVYASGLKLDTGAAGTPAIVRPGIGGTIATAGPSAGGMAGQGSAQANAYTGTQLGGIITMPIGVGKDLGRVTWREILTR